MDNTARHLDLCRPRSKWTPEQEMGIGDLLPDQALLRIPAPVREAILLAR